MSRLGDKIKSVRVDMGFSQKQLAKKLGVAENFINEVELGKRVINESLINRISKVLGKNINDITMSIEEEGFLDERNSSNNANVQIQVSKTAKRENIKPDSQVNDLWTDAFSSVLKTVAIYKYDLKEITGKRQMPVMSNKIDGFAQDKVVFIEIESEDMIGYRISKGDIAFGHLTHEVENNSICLIEHNGDRMIRQIKKLDNNKVLLISNSGTTRTETAYIKDINILVKLDRLEIKL